MMKPQWLFVRLMTFLYILGDGRGYLLIRRDSHQLRTLCATNSRQSTLLFTSELVPEVIQGVIPDDTPGRGAVKSILDPSANGRIHQKKLSPLFDEENVECLLAFGADTESHNFTGQGLRLGKELRQYGLIIGQDPIEVFRAHRHRDHTLLRLSPKEREIDVPR